MKEIKTNNGKKGGWLVGKRHYDKNGKPLGGIKAIVTDAGGRPVELEGGEVIINREASKKHWKELSRINQSAGNGVAIGPPSGYDEDPEDNYENGGKIEFNPNHIPNKWILSYAEKIKKNHPEIWKLGGNIFGNEAFNNLKRVADRGHWLDSEEWMYIKWRAYVARHQRDYRIEGVVAMLKWVDKVEKGWPYMKQLIEQKIDKLSKKGWRHKTAKMKKGGDIQPKDLTKINNFKNIQKGIDYYSYSDNIEKQQKSDRWYELFLKNQKDKQLTSEEYKEFISLSNELAWEDLMKEGGELPNLNNYKTVIKISGIKNPNDIISGGIKNKYKGSYKSIFNILNEDSIFSEVESADEHLVGNDFYVLFKEGFDAPIYDKISKLKNVEIIKQMKDGGSVDNENILIVTKYLLNRHPKKGDIFKGGKVDGYKIIKIKKIKKHFGITFHILILDTKPNSNGAFNRRIVSYNPQDKKITDFFKSNLTATKGTYYTGWDDSELNEKLKTGGSVAQTPAPKKDRIYGSDVNKPKSSSSAKSGSSIKFSKELTDTISDKVKEHNSNNPIKKVTLAVAKAVVRRGMGAYSSSHRPTITGGKPNDRTAWGLARLNAFFYKIEHGKSKSGKYTQDDDLIEELGYKVAKYHLGGDMSMHLAPNGKPSNLTHEQWHLVRTPAFKAWFGDWENDSTIKDISYKTKEPLVWYHSTKENFLNKKGENIFRNPPFYFAQTPDISEEIVKVQHKYKKGKIITKPFFIKRRNTFDISNFSILSDKKLAEIIKSITIYKTDSEISFFQLKLTLPNQDKNTWVLVESPQVQDWIKEKGYDSFIIWENGTQNLAVFSPEQIKLADGTNTTFDGNNPDIRFADGGLIAPNGKPSNLTPEQYKLVRTPEFKAWFGDWENDSENASKVVDENGEPLVMYHGTQYGQFNEFDRKQIGRNYKEQPFGFYFTSIKTNEKLGGYSAKEYAHKVGTGKSPYIFEVFLNIKNPIFQEVYSERPAEAIDFESTELQHAIRKSRFTHKKLDGVIAESKWQKTKEIVAVALKSNQIKLADGTNTTFDGSNPNIRFKDGGNIEYQSRDLNGTMVYYKRDSGGKWQFISKDEFDKNANKNNIVMFNQGGELAMGIKAEHEHSHTIDKFKRKGVSDIDIETAIAKDHLKEDPHYYSKLAKMEGKKYAFGGVLTTGLKGILQGKTNKQVEVVSISDKIVTYIDIESGKKIGLYKDKFIEKFIEKEGSVSTPQSSKPNLNDLSDEKRDALIQQVLVDLEQYIRQGEGFIDPEYALQSFVSSINDQGYEVDLPLDETIQKIIFIFFSLRDLLYTTEDGETKDKKIGSEEAFKLMNPKASKSSEDIDQRIKDAIEKFRKTQKVEDLPKGLVLRVWANQKAQGNQPTSEIAIGITGPGGNFDWSDSKEGGDFWNNIFIGYWLEKSVLKVIGTKEAFFEAPSKSSDLETLYEKSEISVQQKETQSHKYEDETEIRSERDLLIDEYNDIIFLISITPSTDVDNMLALKQQSKELKDKLDALDLELKKKIDGEVNLLENLFKASAVKPQERYQLKPYNDGFAPNGQPTELPKHIYDWTMTEEFINWFGNFTTAYNYKNSGYLNTPCSVVVNKNYEPLIVYHGTGAEFSFFKFDKFPAMYFAENVDYANWFAEIKGRETGSNGYIYPFLLNIRTPLDLTHFKIDDVSPQDFIDWMFLQTGLDEGELKINKALLNPNGKYKAWMYMRNSPEMLQVLREKNVCDGIIYYEDNPSVDKTSSAYQTKAYIVFNSNSAKIADPSRDKLTISAMRSFYLKKGGKV
jgi:hypothetical protein